KSLSTLYTNKHAEFRFPNLSEGEYYVQALADEKTYEPVTQRVRLARGQIYELAITLRKKEEVARRKAGGGVGSGVRSQQNSPGRGAEGIRSRYAAGGQRKCPTGH